MEAWIDLAFPSYYKAYKVNDIYHSVLWVHDLYEQGHYFTKLKRGVLIDKLLFAYLPPTVKQ